MEKIYPYKPRLSGSLLGILIFAVSTQFFAWKAFTNEQVLLINGMFYLTPENARVFYGVFTGIGLVITSVLIGYLVMGLVANRRIILNDLQIKMPKNLFSGSNLFIPYRTIFKLQANAMGRQRMLVITHVDGNATILESFLPSRQSFEELCAILDERVRNNRI